MKKIFSFLCAVMAAVAMNATVVTFTFNTEAGLSELGIAKPADGQGTTLTSISKDGVTITFNKGTASTNPRVFCGSGNNSGKLDLRVYSGSKITISVAGMTAVEFAGSATFSEIPGLAWTGNADSQEFSPTGTTKITTITVTYGEAAQVWTPDTIGVTEARALIEAGDKHDHYVQGVVATFPSDPGTYGNTIFWLTDIENETDSLEGYRIQGFDNAKFANQASIPFTKGDVVLLYAFSLELYQETGKNDIYEINTGYLAEILSSEITRQELQYTAGVVSFDSRDGIMTIQMGEDFSAEVETSSVAAFAGTYATAMTIGDVTLPEDAKIKFTFVKVENGAHIYHVSMVYTVEETKVQYVINSDVAFTSDDTSFGTIDDGSNAPVITCAEADAWAQGKSDNTKSTVDYVVYGYFIKYGTATNNPGQYDPEKGYATFYLDDNAAAEKGAFQAYKCEPADPSYTSPAVGDIVAVRGKLQAYKNSCEIAGGKYERYTATGIEDVVAAPKATKTILNGQVVIIKNGELFNVLGTKL